MNFDSVIEVKDLTKKFRGFQLDIPELRIPKGFATALIGENGAGKTTFMNILSGIRLDYKGQLQFFGQWSDKERDRKGCPVKEQIGYTGTGNYYLPNWNVKQVREVSSMLFTNFHPERFDSYCEKLGVVSKAMGGKLKKVSDLSDGTKTKLMLATVLARDTDMLILDEPASPLDPLMRDKLCELIHEYIDEGNGEKSVLFSTHNISDMENVTDYAVIMEHGAIVEQGFVEELKEKYVMVKGEAEDTQAAKQFMYSMSSNNYGFEGICLAKDVDKLAGMDVQLETPTLFQISVAVMKANTSLKFA